MPAVDAVILDLGNVLVFHDNALLFRRMAARFGRDEAEVARFVEARSVDINRGDLDAQALRRAVCDAFGTDLPADEFATLWNCHFTPNEPMLRGVEALVGRTRLVLLSNTNAVHYEWLRPRLPVLARFDDRVASHEVGLVKPERAIFEEAVRRAETTPERAVFFDDVPAYVDAARAAGLQAHVFVEADSALATIESLLA